MISLSVKERCQNCPEFSPTVEQMDASTLGDGKNLIQIVYCVHQKLCDSIEKHSKNIK